MQEISSEQTDNEQEISGEQAGNEEEISRHYSKPWSGNDSSINSY